MEATEARDRCEMLDRKIALEVAIYVFQHPGQSSAIEPFLGERRGSRDHSAGILKKPYRKTGSQCLDKEPAGRSFGLELSQNRKGDLGDKRVLERAFVAKQLRPRLIDAAAPTIRRQAVRRKIEMKHPRQRIRDIDKVSLQTGGRQPNHAALSTRAIDDTAA